MSPSATLLTRTEQNNARCTLEEEKISYYFIPVTFSPALKKNVPRHFQILLTAVDNNNIYRYLKYHRHCYAICMTLHAISNIANFTVYNSMLLSNREKLYLQVYPNSCEYLCLYEKCQFSICRDKKITHLTFPEGKTY